MQRRGLICGLLAVAVIAVYWRVLKCDFVRFDDPGYVTENAHVLQGLTVANVRWAFTTGAAANWHPLTWLSHMADVQLFGLKPWGHHFSNLLLHISNTLLLFLVLDQMTGRTGRNAIVAGLFGLHPLHVESVAWVAERKDVLSAFFFLLTVSVYTRYVQAKESVVRSQQSEVQSSEFEVQSSGFRICFYLLSLILFALGLMSKPMLVTTPFVLLLLDFWPLGRFSSASRFTFQVSRLLLEKAPFFALAIASSIITFLVQKQGGALLPSEGLGFSARLSNAIISYLTYLWKAVWPINLAIFYPHPGTWPIWKILMAAAMLIFISGFTIAAGGLSRRKYLVTGWGWYLGMLVPVIGFVQVGAQAWADRYSYLPLIGVFIMAAWAIADLSSSLPTFRVGILSTATAIVLVGCAIGTIHQLQFWQNSERLFSHAIAVTTDNYVAFLSRGAARMEQRRLEEAVADYRESLRIRSDCAPAHLNLGNALALQGKKDEALGQFADAVRLMPKYARAYYSWGLVLEQMGQGDEAIDHFEQAVRFDLDLQEARVRLANALFSRNRNKEAIVQYRKALETAPSDPALHHWLASALAREKAFEEARGHFEISLKFRPDNPAALNDLAWLITEENVSNRNVTEGIRLARRACELSTNREAMYLDTLAAAYSEAGQFEKAIEASQKALTAAEQTGETKLATRIEARLTEYQKGRSYHALAADLKQ